MKRLIFLHVDISKKINTLLTLIITSSFFFASSTYADEKWKVDKELSTISFELPVLFVKNVLGFSRTASIKANPNKQLGKYPTPKKSHRNVTVVL